MPTPVPVLINSEYNGGYAEDNPGRLGPFQDPVSKNVFILYTDYTNIHMLVSTDGGLTFTLVDDAHAPLGGEVTLDAIYNSTTRLITIVCEGEISTETFDMNVFDTHAQTWGIVSTSPLYLLVGNIACMDQRANGDFVVVASFTKVISFANRSGLYFVIWNPISGWSALPTAISTPALTGTYADLEAFGIVNGGTSGRMHVIAIDGGSLRASGGGLYHICINADNTFTSGDTITLTEGPPANSFFGFAEPAYVESTDTLVLSEVDLHGEWRIWIASEQQVPSWIETDTGINTTLVPGLSYNYYVAPDGSAYIPVSPDPFEIWQSINGAAPTKVLTLSAGSIVNITAGIVNGQNALVYSVDPIPNDDQNAEESFFSFVGGSPTPRSTPSVYIDTSQLAFTALPDPAKRCNDFGPPRCVKVNLKKRVLRGKTYTYVREH